MVDCARAAILLPLGVSIYKCQPVNKCSLVETAFLLLVTVSTVNMLTTVLNDSPVFPEDSEGELEQTAPLLMDSPQCVLFGTFMIWFASITINLGPTFLSGALAANSESRHNLPSCPLVHGTCIYSCRYLTYRRVYNEKTHRCYVVTSLRPNLTDDDG